MENLLSFLDLAIPHASINEAPKSDVIIDLGFRNLLLVISKNLKSFVKHADLPISLDENSDLDRNIVRTLIILSEV